MYIYSYIHSQESNGGAEVDGQVVIPAGQKLSAEVGISSVLQCVAGCCIVLQRDIKSGLIRDKLVCRRDKSCRQRYVFQVCCSVVQRVAACCSVL